MRPLSPTEWRNASFDPIEEHIKDFGLEGDLKLTVTRIDNRITHVSLDDWTLYHDEDDSLVKDDALVRDLFDSTYLLDLVISLS